MAICGTFQLKNIFSRTLTVDHTQVPSTQANFPVLVRLSNRTFKHVSNGGHVQNVSGFDIQFFSDAALTTKLKWEMERYNPSTGEIVAWAKIVSLSSASDTVFYMSYGDPTIVSDQSDAVNTFSNSYLGVYHLGNGNTLSVADSTNTNNGTNHGATAAGGQIDGAGNFASASSQYIDLGTAINPTAITLSAWVNAISFPSTFIGVIVRKNASNVNYSQLFVNSSGRLACFVFANADVSYSGTGSNTMVIGTSYFIAMSYDSSAGLLGYVNGSSDHAAVAANGNLVTTASSTYIGQDPITAGRFWNGMIDDARVSSVARSTDWISTEYNNQKDGSTFVTLGAET